MFKHELNVKKGMFILNFKFITMNNDSIAFNFQQFTFKTMTSDQTTP